MTTINMKSALGRSVVAADSAESLGEVQNFLLDAEGRNVSKIHVAGRGKRAELLPWSAVTFGPDVVMAADSAQLVSVEGDRELEAVKGEVVLLDARILDTGGCAHGRVSDVEIDTRTGEVVAVESMGTRIAARDFCSLGPYALVVDAGAFAER
jgi:uncharacterized protein YrrD